MGKIQKFEDAGAIFTEDCGLPRTDGLSYDDILADDEEYGNIRYINTAYGKKLQCVHNEGTFYDAHYAIDRPENMTPPEGSKYTTMFRWKLPNFGYTAGYLEYHMMRGGLSIYFGDGYNYSFNGKPIPDIEDVFVCDDYNIRNEFVNIAILIDEPADTLDLYVNGQFKVTLDDAALPGGFYGNTLMGRTIEGGYDGNVIQEIGDLVIFDRHLTEEEIIAYHNNKLVDYDLNTIHSYDFDNLNTLYNKGVLETGSGLVKSSENGGWGMDLSETAIGTGINSGAYGTFGANAIEFDSPLIPTGDSKPFTVTMWSVFDGWPAGDGDDRRFFCNYNDSDTGFECFIGGSGNKLVFRHKIGGASNIWLNSSEDFPVSKLTHLTFTWDGTGDTDSVKLYINGELDDVDSPRVSGNIDESPQNLNMFNKPTETTTNERLNGTVTNIKAFDKVLTPSEVKYLYTTELIGRN